MAEYVVTGTGGSRTAQATERVQIMAGIQGPAGADGTVFVWLGAWVTGTTYVADDAVYDPATGAAYICLATNLNDPPASSGNWSLLADPTVSVANHIASTTGEHDNFQRRMGWPLIDDVSGGYYFTLAYVSGTRTVTLTSNDLDPDVAAGDLRYYHQGRRVTKTGPISLQHAAGENGYFFYFDENDTLVVSTTPWSLSLHVPVAYVYYSGTEGVCYEERHTIYADPQIHEALHFAIGTFVQEGFSLTDYTLDQGDSAGIRWTLAPGVVRDEDLPTSTTQVATPDYTVIYRDGAAGTWAFMRDKSDPVLSGGTYAMYNEWTGATWQLTELANNQFVNYFIFATPSVLNANKIFVVPGQDVFATQTGAETEVIEAVQMGGLIAQEIAGVWRVTFKTNAANTSTGKVEIVQVDQIFSQRSGSVTAAAPTDHSSLSGRSDLTSHPAAAIENTPAGTLAATDVQAAIDELAGEKFQNDGSEVLLGADGTTALPGLAFASQPSMGFNYIGVNTMGWNRAGVNGMMLGGTYHRLSIGAAWSFGWAAGSAASGTNDLTLGRAAEGEMKQVCPTAATTAGQRIYHDAAGAANYLRYGWNAANICSFGPVEDGGGANRFILHGNGNNPGIEIRPAGYGITTGSLNLHSTYFGPQTDGGSDLGQSADYRWDNIYAKTVIAAPTFVGTAFGTTTAANAAFTYNSVTKMQMAAGGVQVDDDLFPGVDGTLSCGGATLRWNFVYTTRVRAKSGTAALPGLGMGNANNDGFFSEWDTVNWVPKVTIGGVDQGGAMGKKMDAAFHRYGGNIPSPTGAIVFNVGRAKAGTVLKVYALVTGGTSVTLNCAQDGNDLRSANLVVSAGAGWVDFGTLQNDTLAGGDAMTIEVVSVSGTPNEVAFQIEVEPA